MADRVVLLNGLPASGKSVLGAQLASALDIPFLSKDIIKEALGAMAWPIVASDRLGGLALDSLYALAAAVSGPVLLDSIWLTGRDERFLSEGLVAMGGPQLVEIWCEVSEKTARARFEARMPSRHPMHGSWRPGFWSGAGPLSTEAIIVNTEGSVDIEAVADRVRIAWGS